MRVVVKSLLGLSLISSIAWAEPVPTANPPAAGTTTTTPAAAAPKPNILAATAGAKNQETQEQTPEDKKLTAEQIAKQKVTEDAKVRAMVKDQATRLQQLEKANLDALSQNQELQLKNDNLGVQVQVLQSERSAQMFLYGAATIAVGVLLGFLIASYIYTKRRRQW
ncbi:hypothetical protein [Acinetobacter gerneri]|uniref:SH3 domain protein n=1 Tax=Acinetobacter gerneri DSM 14967 = CIP 107464 = MTCC 9824 TaxID=1120926 RepID=N8ZNI3_9GAMM|nr:hypothetical protein [Acinetobacter gerneri]ENV35314.1 hypothetical protein F960_00612 [Acinetobacter gerneri DSM 14967 = CIP 107464 = MTCC 9824]EPR81280.1 putative signal peptide protein [Acinetobacter gerneri DSM 14967 = CIP 107464 = MTCC 9824]